MQKILISISKLRKTKTRIVVAIDGRGGAGKSTLARALVENLDSACLFEFDWFHLPKSEVTAEKRSDTERFIAEVVIPFKSGLCPLTFSKYNWGYLSGKPDGLDEVKYKLKSAEVLVVEGCNTLNPELSAHLDFCIWVDTDAEEALERGMRRDIEEYGLDPVKVTAAWKEWRNREEKSLEIDNRKLRADIVL